MVVWIIEGLLYTHLELPIVRGQAKQAVQFVYPRHSHSPRYVLLLLDQVNREVDGHRGVQQACVAEGKGIVQETCSVVGCEDLQEGVSDQVEREGGEVKEKGWGICCCCCWRGGGIGSGRRERGEGKEKGWEICCCWGGGVLDQVGGREGKGRRKGGKFVVVGGVLDQVGGREGKGRKGGKFVGFFFFCVCVGGGGGEGIGY